MADHISKVGGSLGRSVKSFNDFVGSLEGSVLPQGRRFKELGIADGQKTLEVLDPLDIEVREPARGRDLILEEGPELPGLAAE
jgi:DNA recombination protein RmuC